MLPDQSDSASDYRVLWEEAARAALGWRARCEAAEETLMLVREHLDDVGLWAPRMAGRAAARERFVNEVGELLAEYETEEDE